MSHFSKGLGDALPVEVNLNAFNLHGLVEPFIFNRPLKAWFTEKIYHRRWHLESSATEGNIEDRSKQLFILRGNDTLDTMVATVVRARCDFVDPELSGFV